MRTERMLFAKRLNKNNAIKNQERVTRCARGEVSESEENEKKWRVWYTAASWLTSNSACPEWGRGRDTTCHLGDRPPTVPPHPWGWGCPVQEPSVTSGNRPSTSVVNLGMTGKCHSPGQSVQEPSDLHHLDGRVVQIGLTPGFVLGWAGTNRVPILKPTPIDAGYMKSDHHNNFTVCFIVCCWPFV